MQFAKLYNMQSFLAAYFCWHNHSTKQGKLINCCLRQLESLALNFSPTRLIRSLQAKVDVHAELKPSQFSLFLF